MKPIVLHKDLVERVERYAMATGRTPVEVVEAAVASYTSIAGDETLNDILKVLGTSSYAMTYNEISHETGLPHGTVKNAVKRGIALGKILCCGSLKLKKRGMPPKTFALAGLDGKVK